MTVTLSGTNGLNQPVNATVPTGADGTYQFTGVTPGDYTITYNDTVNTPSYNTYVVTNSFTNLPGSAEFTPQGRKWEVGLVSGTPQADRDFALSDKAVVAGVVWHDQNADALESAGEERLEGIAIQVTYSPTLDGTYTALPGGAFTTSGDPAKLGQYFLEVDQIGYYKVTMTLPTPAADWGVTNTPEKVLVQILHVPAMGVRREADFGIAQYVALSGRVWKENDADGAYDSTAGSGDAPLSAHALTILRNGTPLGFTSTSGDGTFSIRKEDKIFPGDFTVLVDEYGDNTHYVTNTDAGYTAEYDFDPDTRTWTLDDVRSGESRTEINCAFTPLRKIEGKVWHDKNADGVQQSGPPAEENLQGLVVVLEVWDADAGAYKPYHDMSTATAEDGTFAFSGLPVGTYRARVTGADNYYRTNPEGGGAFTKDKFVEYVFGNDTDQAPVNKDIALVLPVRLSGRSFLDKNSDGAYTSAADGPVSVAVQLEKLDSEATYPPFQTSAADGSYDSGAWVLFPGTYTVTFDPIANHSVSNTDAGENPNSSFMPAARTWTVTLLSGEEAEDLDIGYQRSDYSIAGFVWKDGDGNGLYNDPAEIPFTDADNIVVTATHKVSGNTYTGFLDADGAFSIPVDEPGDFEITLTLPSDYVITNRDSRYDRQNDLFTATVTYENPKDHVDIGAARASSIAGMLWWDVNGNAKQDGSDYAFSQQEAIQLLEILPNGQMRLEAEGITDALGNFSFTGLKPGRYLVSLPNQSGYFFTGYEDVDALPETISRFDPKTGEWQIQLEENVNLTNASSGYHTPSVIGGTLYDQSDKKPLSGYKIALMKKDAFGVFREWMTDKTNEQGEYRFENLLPGEYEIHVNIPSGYDKTSDSSGSQNGSVVTIPVTIAGMGESKDEMTKVYYVVVPEPTPKPVKPAPKPEKPTPKPDPVPEKPGGSETDSPTTGDNFPYVFVLLAGGAACALCVLLLLRRKEKMRKREDPPETDL